MIKIASYKTKAKTKAKTKTSEVKTDAKTDFQGQVQELQERRKKMKTTIRDDGNPIRNFSIGT